MILQARHISTINISQYNKSHQNGRFIKLYRDLDMKKLIVITGASSGIGEAIAKHFSDLGHPLLLIARRLEQFKSAQSTKHFM